MPKKKKSKKQPDRTATRDVKQRMARDEQLRERQAALIGRRAQDPRFSHRKRMADGSSQINLSPQASEGIADAMGRQQEKFKRKFGRPMGPDDPVFFDESADEPTPLGDGHWTEMIQEMVDLAEQRGMDTALIRGWGEVGFMLTHENEHMFSADDVRQYHDAVEYFRVIDVMEDGVSEPAYKAGIAAFVIYWVQRALDTDDLTAAGKGISQVRHVFTDGPEDYSSVMFLLIDWLFTAGDRGVGRPSKLQAWVAERDEEFGEVAARILKTPRTKIPGLLNDPVINPAFLPTLFSLATALVATEGNSTPQWLRQFDDRLDWDDLYGDDEDEEDDDDEPEGRISFTHGHGHEDHEPDIMVDRDGVEGFVATVLRDRSVEVPVTLIGELEDVVDEQASMMLASMIETLAAWITGARDAGRVNPQAVVEWIKTTDGLKNDEVAQLLGGLYGLEGHDPEVDPETLMMELGPYWLSAMMLVAAGIAADSGGDVRWLRQFDPR